MRILLIIAVLIAIVAPHTAAAGSFSCRIDGIGLRLPIGTRIEREDLGIRIELPFTAGTTLVEKYVLIEPTATERDLGDGMEVGGVSLWCESGSEGAAGSVYDYVKCSAILNDGRRIAITFVLHSVNPEMFDSPPPLFDRAQEVLPFWGIILSLHALP